MDLPLFYVQMPIGWRLNDSGYMVDDCKKTVVIRVLKGCHQSTDEDHIFFIIDQPIIIFGVPK